MRRGEVDLVRPFALPVFLESGVFTAGMAAHVSGGAILGSVMPFMGHPPLAKVG